MRSAVSCTLHRLPESDANVPFAAHCAVVSTRGAKMRMGAVRTLSVCFGAGRAGRLGVCSGDPGGGGGRAPQAVRDDHHGLRAGGRGAVPCGPQAHRGTGSPINLPPCLVSHRKSAGCGSIIQRSSSAGAIVILQTHRQVSCYWLHHPVWAQLVLRSPLTSPVLRLCLPALTAQLWHASDKTLCTADGGAAASLVQLL